jgi:tRNA A-37 threonylcarbamoyl transferase component Bud32
VSEEFEGAHKGMVVAGVYEIVRLIGGGITSDVWEARDVTIDRRVALKVLRPIISRDPRVQERFDRERKVHGNLRHDHIVRVFGADKSEPVGLWMAMELMEQDLGKTFSEKRPLAAARAIELLAPIASALDYAHKQGRIHRDVKPANILLDDQGRPHLSDFGIAMIRGVTRITATGGLIGTYGYASPEQEKGEEVDGSADVYSLAVVLFQTVTGTMPNPVAKPGEEIDWAEVPSASSRNPELPRQLDAVVRRGMSANAKDRYPSASALIAAARQAIELAPAAPEVVAPAPRPRRAGRRVSLFTAGSALLLLLLFGIGVGAGAATQEDPPTEPPTAARAGGLELQAPPGWSAHSVRRPRIAGLGLERPVELRLGDGSEMAFAAGISAVRGPTLLPSAYRDQPAAAPSRRERRALGSLQAYRYSGLATPGTALSITVFVVPTSVGVATLACGFADREELSEVTEICGRVASTLRITGGKAYALGPSPVFARALRKRIDRLIDRRIKGERAMENARDGEGQAVAAEGVAAAFGRAAAELASLRITPESAWGRRAVVSALGANRRRYEDVAAASRAEDDPAYMAAVDALNRAEERLSDALAGLRTLGYRAT